MSDLVYRDHPLSDYLPAAVPLAIRNLEDQGGPGEADWRRATRLLAELASCPDPILYRGMESAPLVAKLAFVLAVFSFARGGVTFYGMHFEGGEAENETPTGGG